MKKLVTALFSLTLVVILVACGNKSGTGPGDGGGDGDGGIGDDGNTGCTGLCTDAPPFTGMCDPTSSNQCSNCMDDDGDGLIDGFDIHCAGPLDDDENSFSTGIPGDNIDAVKQDCFFDGNSGGGNDGCDIHVCCILGAPTVAACPIGANRYKPNDCPPPIGNKPLSQQCIDNCGTLTPPGCDCFGCCTICDPLNPTMCYDIATNPSTSPMCTAQTLADPTKCLPCQQNTMCGNDECGGATCILCPGQDPSTLPPSCGGMTMCPIGTTACDVNNACPSQTYCSNGCCIGIIQ